MVMTNTKPLKLGSRVTVPWGFGEPRRGVVVEVWGDPGSPTHVRVQLDAVDPDDDELAVLLLSPGMVSPAA